MPLIPFDGGLVPFVPYYGLSRFETRVTRVSKITEEQILEELGEGHLVTLSLLGSAWTVEVHLDCEGRFDADVRYYGKTIPSDTRIEGLPIMTGGTVLNGEDCFFYELLPLLTIAHQVIIDLTDRSTLREEAETPPDTNGGT